MKRRNLALYAAKKLLLFLLSVFLLSAAVFWAARLAPGDPLASYYGERKLTPEQRSQAEERLGLHDSIPVQYLCWLERALQGDFGISYKYKMPASEVVARRMGNTLLLGGTGFLPDRCFCSCLPAPCCWAFCAPGMRTGSWTALCAGSARSPAASRNSGCPWS